MAIVEGILRSEMLDEKTCEVCMLLDGILLPADAPEWNGELGQYAHPNCRAVWIPVYDMGVLDFTKDINIPDVFMKANAIKLIDSWEDLPMPTQGAERLAEKLITIEEEMDLLVPAELIGAYLGIKEEGP